MQKRLNDIPIYRITIAEDLMNMGFSLMGVAKNKKNPEMLVFYFENNKEVKEVLKNKYNIIIQK